MERSHSSFLNLNDASISDVGDDERTRAFVPLATKSSKPDVHAPLDANTPRAAPSIMLPMQQADSLNHVSIGAVAVAPPISSDRMECSRARGTAWLPPKSHETSVGTSLERLHPPDALRMVEPEVDRSDSPTHVT